VRSRESLIHVPSDLDPDITREGNEAAKFFRKALRRNSARLARAAASRYADLAQRERHGDEYTAFQWFCEYVAAGKGQRREMLADPLRAAYFHELADNSFSNLLRYVETRYPLGDRSRPLAGKLAGRPGFFQRALLSLPVIGKVRREYITQDDLSFWRDFVLFNNPCREQWERTSQIIAKLNLKPGEAVADIGSGPGYYSFPFARLVGPAGRVYAVDTNERHLDFVKRVAVSSGDTNITTVASKFNDICLPAGSVDVAYICSLYGIIYSTSMEKVKDEFVASIRKALRPGGRLVIVDNAIVRDPVLPYIGHAIDPLLVKLQMRHYGFELTDEFQYTPQRYGLIFRVAGE
jgi:ubiquinone/menaquinone biosynthesis C-methylase UbiE